MDKGQISLLDLDVEKLFETHALHDIEKIYDLFELEIEKKRIELRSMVGDRYRDVLAASDAIKWMQNISEQTVGNIQSIIDQCEALVAFSSQSSTGVEHIVVPPEVAEERTIVIQIRLFIILNEEIFVALDSDEMFKAAQIYLLAQHVYTGLRLLRKNILESIPFMGKLKNTLDMLRAEILCNINSKLKKNYLDAEDTCSNLNALLLLENRNLPELLRIFTNFRIDALKSLINQPSHTSVRLKITDMIKSLISTIRMLHDCFLNNLEDCKLNLEMGKIISEPAPTTLSFIKLPDTPLVAYIPEITKRFKPKCTNFGKLTQQECVEITNEWLAKTKDIVDDGIQESLNLVNNIKGLHIIRDEAANINIPENWENICNIIGYPALSNIWIYMFQGLVTRRVKTLVTKKIVDITDDTFKNIIKFINSKKTTDIPTWKEELEDVGLTENEHKGLHMKTKGFSQGLVQVCETFDEKYLSLLEEITLYLYGETFSPNFKFTASISKDSKVKFIDREPIEKHLKIECKTKTLEFLAKLDSHVNSETNGNKKVAQSLVCARMLYGFTELCPNFKICCNCYQINQTDWLEICAEFSNKSLKFWTICVQDCCQQTDDFCAVLFSNFDSYKVLKLLLKWDIITIEEQTDNNIYKSQIRVPMKPSCIMQEVLTLLSNYLNKLTPHTFPKQIHQQFIEQNVIVVFSQYEKFLVENVNQTVALQLLFDIKFLTTFCVARENLKLIKKSQDICAVLRKNVDPFDLDVFYKYLQNNVKQSVLQSKVILGCLLPSSSQLASIGILEKNKEQEKNPSVLALSIPTTATWFPLLPITSPLQKKTPIPIAQPKDSEPLTKSFTEALTSTSRKAVDAGSSVRFGAAALFGAMTNDWFS